MEIKHTPTPWVSKSDNIETEAGFMVGHALVSGLTVEGCNANAAFIVRAANNFDDMLELLRDCLEDYGHPNFTDRHSMAPRLRAAIAKAEGK